MCSYERFTLGAPVCRNWRMICVSWRSRRAPNTTNLRIAYEKPLLARARFQHRHGVAKMRRCTTWRRATSMTAARTATCSRASRVSSHSIRPPRACAARSPSAVRCAPLGLCAPAGRLQSHERLLRKEVFILCAARSPAARLKRARNFKPDDRLFSLSSSSSPAVRLACTLAHASLSSKIELRPYPKLIIMCGPAE